MVCVWVAGKLCDPLVTHGLYLRLSALEMYHHDKVLYKFTLLLY